MSCTRLRNCSCSNCYRYKNLQSSLKTKELLRSLVVHLLQDVGYTLTEAENMTRNRRDILTTYLSLEVPLKD
jgi:hypothetical protein